MEQRDKKVSRRSFLGRGAASLVGAGIGLAGSAGALAARPGPQADDAKKADDKPTIKEFRALGRTGYKVSDISFGGATMTDPALLEYAMDRGINYVDTARQYYDMEVVIGKLFPAKRDKLFVTTKLQPELVTAEVTVDAIMAGIDESLQRLNTDYVDCCLIHSVGDPNLGDITRIQNPNIVTAFNKAKQQGKIKCWGASSHGPKMIEDFNWLLDNTDIDMIMPGMNLLTKGLEPVLAKARQKNVAIVAMKSLSAARKIDYSQYMKEGRTARQGLLKWMLAQPNLDTISVSMRTFEDVDELVAASGNPDMSMKERKVLMGYCALLERDYCRPGCDACMGSCPHNVPIHDILRYRLYFNNYGREKYAMGLYAELPRSRRADLCATCTGTCESSCPHNLGIRSKLLMAHDELTV
jgi:predicted aldo/keto reductase-like oxidoreductase